MIDNISFSRDWIMGRRRIFKRNDPSIMEKTIHAFALLEILRSTGMDFVFKGGTSLLLLLPGFQRFSIDVDIVFEGSEEELDGKLEILPEEGIFSKFEKDARGESTIPKAHYKFGFRSTINDREDSILLDVLFDKNEYPKVDEISIEYPLLKTSGNQVTITVPTISSILGDKLTAFAPNTTGIKYGVGKSTEIIKQLFDIGSLFDKCTDLDTLFNSFRAICRKEISYRGSSLTHEAVLQDIFNTAITLGMNGRKDPQNFAELKKGALSFSSYVFGNRFSMTDAINKASKAAYISSILLGGGNVIQRFDPSVNLKEVFIEKAPYNTLNKIKKTDPEAFFYFMKSCSVL